MFRIIGKQLAPGMRHCPRCLQKQKALLGSCGIHSATNYFIYDSFVIALGIVTKQRKHEPILAPGRPMASA